MNEEKEQTTELITDYGGSCVVFCHCKNCGQYMQYATERKFNLCPYCGLKILWQE